MYFHLSVIIECTQWNLSWPTNHYMNLIYVAFVQCNSHSFVQGSSNCTLWFIPCKVVPLPCRWVGLKVYSHVTSVCAFAFDTKNNGMFSLDVCVCVCVNVQHCVNVKHQEWVQTHSVHLCLRFHWCNVKLWQWRWRKRKWQVWTDLKICIRICICVKCQ